MDPYLEDPGFWQDFHRRFITHFADTLGDQLPAAYEARIDERVRLVDASSDQAPKTLDVAVHRKPDAPPVAAVAGSGVATLEPVAIPMAVTEEVRDVWLEILHKPDRSLVTSVELLSPSNKTGTGYAFYLEKRRAVLARAAHLVEIDLLVGGRRVPFMRPLPRAHYHVFVSRQERLPYVDVYSWSVRDPLPPVPIPLRAPDPDAVLNLGAVVAHTFQRGRYLHSLRYDAPPPAPFAADDAAWVQAIAQSVRQP